MQTLMSIGHDCELMLANERGKPISAIPVLKQGKDNRIDLGDGLKIYYDNVLAETNIPPSSNKKELRYNCKELFRRFKANFDKNLLLARASHYYTKREMRRKAARELGCNPETDVYSGTECYPPNINSSLRSGGGHIHIGNRELSENPDAYLGDKFTKMELIRLCDLFIGVPFVLLDNDKTSQERKRLYGKAGRYRETPYGVEYRTLSNYWLTTPELTELIYDLTALAFDIGINGQAGEYLRRFDQNEIIDCINNSNKDQARQLLARLELPMDLFVRVMKLSQENFSENIYENWGI